MDELERQHETELPQPPSGAGPAGGQQSLRAARDAGAAFLAAADAAIDQVLSGDSLAFNTALRQQGGE
jgi:hypothetical protein